MTDRFAVHVERLIADAEAEAAAGDWSSARSLAEAALSLQPGHVSGQRILRSAQTALARGGERRQLTIMFSDVVGSTQLSSQAEPEIIRDILRAYQGTCGEVVAEYDGHIASYVGDGVVAYFGYPTTHEDDPIRAVRAGLHLLDALQEVTEQARDRYRLSFAVRVAVHTGVVVRSEMGSRDLRDVDAVVGAAPNIASRLQEHARPGTLLISAATRELVRNAFTTHSVGALELRGIPHPVEAFEVVGEEVLVAAPVPFCGRQAEMAALRAAWASGGAVLVIGEPGIGKSRLASELAAEVRSLTAACSTFHTATAFYPARRLVEAACGIDTRDPPERTLPLLRAALQDIGLEDMLSVMADLLGVPWEAPELDGRQLREVTMTTLIEWLRAAAAASPILIVIDDVQWCDPSTSELIGRVISARIPGLLLVLTAREGFVAPWSVTTIPVGRLSAPDLRAMAAAIPEAAALDGTAVEDAVSRSGGVPLFLEELVRAAGTPARAFDIDTALPAALVAPLLARLTSAGLDLDLCQAIAAVGREADHDLLAALVGVPDDVLDARLRSLVDAHLVDIVGGEHRAYRFRHELVRELAYETQLRAERRRTHSAIADILDTTNVHGVPSDSGAIGYHLERAERFAGAIEAYVRAAQASLRRGAFAEGIEQLDHSLELLDQITDDNRRDRLELTIRQVRGMMWVSSLGYHSPQALDDFHRCVELSDRIGPDSDPVPGIEAVWYYYPLRSDIDRAEQVIIKERWRAGVDAMPDDGALGAVHFFRGDFTTAEEDLERFLASTYARTIGNDVPAGWPLPDDPVVNTLSFLGAVRMIRADTEGAADAFRRAEERALVLPFPHGPFSRAYRRQVELLAWRIVGEPERTKPLIEELAEIAARHGFLFFQISADQQRMINGAIGQRRAAWQPIVSLFEVLGVRVWEPLVTLDEVRSALAAGAPDEAVACADTGLARASEIGSEFLNAEIQRLRGEARLVLGDTRGAEDIVAALSLARRQGALLFEQRAAGVR